MLEIKITCEPNELERHLQALRSHLPIQANEKVNEVYQKPSLPMTEQKLTPPIMEQKSLTVVDTTAVVCAPIEPEPPKPSDDEAPRRRGRPPKNAELPASDVKPQIATGEERVNPQDLADEKAETVAKTGNGLSVEDVRRKVKAYGDHFGHEAAMTDIRALIGCSISELKTDYDSLYKAIVAISDAIFHNRRPNGERAAEAKPVEAKPVEAKPVEDESLFGGVVSTPVIQRATPDEVNAAGRVYCDVYDGKGKPFKECSNFLSDVQSMVSKLFGDKVKTLRDIEGLSGEREVHYGRLRAEILEAVKTNPYNRKRVS